jgi:pimeloyl-ACP methyl ester carboxylesterase
VPVVLLHGVCFGPETFERPAAALGRRVRVLLPHRRGYGASSHLAPGTEVEQHVEDVIAVMDHEDVEQAVLVGVSGGATIAVAIALAHAPRVAAAVIHEPALGPLAPGVHGLLSTGAGMVAQAAEPGDGAEAMAALLAGPAGWLAQSPEDRARIHGLGPVVRAEVPGFVRFAPTAEQVRGLRGMRLVSSVGGLSRAQRRAAAQTLAELAGARLEVVPQSGHLVQIDAPGTLVRCALRQRREAMG